MADLFISYSRRDLQFVRELVNTLSARGKGCWVDWQDIPPTAEWIQEIYEGIEGSDAFVFVISPESARSETCREEIEHAERLNKRIVPILRRDIDGAQLPDAIASRNWILFLESVDLDEGVDRVVEAMDHDLEHVRRHTRWLEKALEWDKSERESSLLLRGAELRSAEEWLAGAAEHEPAPTPLHYDYARASRAAATGRLRLVIVAFAAAFVVMSGLAAAALVQRDREISARKTAESRLLASSALEQLDNRLDLGASLALAAYRIKKTTQARDSVLVAMRRSEDLVGLLDPGCANLELVRFAPRGELLAAGCADGRVVLVEPQSRTVRPVPGALGAVRSLAFSADGTLLASTKDSKIVELWRIDSDRNVSVVKSLPPLRAEVVAFTPGGELVLLNGEEVATWRPGSGFQRIGRLPYPRYPATKVAVSADGTIAAGSEYGVSVLRPRSARRKAATVGESGNVQDVAFAPTGRRLAIVEGEQVYLGGRRKKLRRLPIAGATTAAFGPGGILATGTGDGDVVIWDADGKRRSSDLRLSSDEVKSVAFDPTHNLIAAAGKGRIAVWSAGESELERSMSTGLGALDALVVTGPRTIVASGGGRVVEQSVMPNSQTALRGGPSGVTTLGASRDGHVVAGGDLNSAQVIIWRGRSPQRMLRWRDHRPVAVAVSADGTTVAEATHLGTLDLWEWKAGSERPDVREVSSPSPLKSVASAPSGRLFAAGAQNGSVWLVDGDAAAQREPVGRIGNGRTSVEAIAFGDDGSSLAAAGSDGRVRVWRLRKGSQRLFPAGGVSLTSVTFDPRGETLAAGDDEGGVFLWDSNTQHRLGPPWEFTGEGGVQAVGFDPSGRTLAIGLNSGTVVLLTREAWDATEAIASLCRRLARPLSEDERRQYLPEGASGEPCR